MTAAILATVVACSSDKPSGPPGVAAKLAFLVPPTNGWGGDTIKPAVQVEIEDAGGSRVTSATDNVTIGIGANPSGGTLLGTKTVVASGGLATFSNLVIDSSGSGYTLTANAGGLSGATSAAFDLAVNLTGNYSLVQLILGGILPAPGSTGTLTATKDSVHANITIVSPDTAIVHDTTLALAGSYVARRAGGKDSIYVILGGALGTVPGSFTITGAARDTLSLTLFTPGGSFTAIWHKS